MKSLNLGILAHVDAGKTSLTESILFHAGVIEQAGSVDTGNTQTDTMELERKRGITIQSSVVSFHLNETKINLIDTPGHADFISEVERSLSVLDAVILVISAVEGIQAQTRILMHAVKKSKKPTLIFVNKIDRAGAKYETLLDNIKQQLKITPIPMVKVNDIASQSVSVEHLTTKDEPYYLQLLESLTEHDEAFLISSIERDLSVSKEEMLQQITSQTSQNDIYPVYFGSAMCGIGIKELFVGMEYYLPARIPNANTHLSGSIFKIERINTHENAYYINLISGTLQTRKSINFYREDHEETVTLSEKASRLKVFEQGRLIDTYSAEAGSIIQAYGLKSVKIGDQLNEENLSSLQTRFARPLLETTIKANDPTQSDKLFNLLNDFAEQDPLISLSKSHASHLLTIKLYGEVQKEVIKERLASEHDINVTFGETKMICIERPTQTGCAKNVMDLHNAPLEYYATLGFEIKPGEIDSGIVYRIDGHAGSLPKGYHSVVKEAVFDYLMTGLRGLQITDCIVSMTDSGVCPLSIAPHFRQLTPILLEKALIASKPVICEPYHHFELEIPVNTLNNVLVALSNVDAKILTGSTIGETYFIEGHIFARHIHALQSTLPSLTHGRGIFASAHAGYQESR